jgi:DNA-binding Lrp family transcriptional regulator
MDNLDRAIINQLQGDFPVIDAPYAKMAQQLGTTENELIERIRKMLADKVLTRFGPMYHAGRLGGGLSLAAMKVAPEDFERVAGIVNQLPEVAHNYARDHALNMWFVLATETLQALPEVIEKIEHLTGYKVYNMPKTKEYFVELKLQV